MAELPRDTLDKLNRFLVEDWPNHRQDQALFNQKTEIMVNGLKELQDRMEERVEYLVKEDTSTKAKIQTIRWVGGVFLSLVTALLTWIGLK